MVITIKKQSVSWAEVAASFLISYNALSNGISWLLSGIIGSTINLITAFQIVMILLLVITIIKFIRNIPIDFFWVFFFFIFAYLISMLSNTNNYYEIIRQNLLYKTFIASMPIYLMIRLTTNLSSVWDYLKYFSYIILITYAIDFFLIDTYELYRTYSAGLIISSAFFLIEWISSDNKTLSYLSIISILFLVLGGRRSTLVSIFLLFVLACLLFRKTKYIIIGIVVFILLFLFLEPLLNFLYNFSLSHGINSRFLRRILIGSLGNDNHRFEQWAYVFELLFTDIKRTLFGLGIAGERHYMLDHFPHMQLQGYPHNVVVEIFGHFGIVIGFILNLFLIVIMPIRSIKITRNKLDYTEAKMLLFSITLFSVLLLQGSYIQSEYFFLYLGFMISIILSNKNELNRV